MESARNSIWDNTPIKQIHLPILLFLRNKNEPIKQHIAIATIIKFPPHNAITVTIIKEKLDNRIAILFLIMGI